MLRKMSLIFLAAAAVGLAAGYAQSGAKINLYTGSVPAADGHQMYTSYCAACHGIDGRGHGPVAGALKQSPTDLTLLSKKNGGKFPANHVITILRFGVETPAHGSEEMPVWGPILGKMSASDIQTRALRISNLTGYLETIQTQ